MRVSALKLLARNFPLLAGLAILAGCATQEDLVRGDVERAVRAAQFDQVLTLVDRAPNAPSSLTNDFLFAACLAHAQMKRYDKLFPCLDQIEANIGSGDKTLVKATGYTRYNAELQRHLLRAEALLELGRYDAAIDAAQIITRSNTSVFNAGGSLSAIRVLPVVGVARALKGEHNEARAIARQLDALTVLPLPELIEIKHAGIARVYAATGDFADALEHIDKSDQTTLSVVLALILAASKQPGAVNSLLPGNYPYVTMPRLYIRMKCLLETGKRDEAKRGLDALLARPQIRVNGEIYWMTLYDRGRIAEMEGSLAEAIRYYQRAIEVIEQYRSSINTEANKIGFVGNKQAVYTRLIELLIATNSAVPAFNYVERAKSRALVDMLASQQEFSANGVSQEELRALIEAARSAEQLAREQSFSAVTRSAPAASAEKLNNVAEEVASLVAVRALTAPQVRERVGADETLIEYYHSDTRLVAFLLTRERMVAFELDAKGLADDISEFRRAIMFGAGDRYRAPSQRLERRLLAPLLPHLATRNIAIVPHGVLHYLPFNALFDGERFLIERFGLRTLPSASVLKFLRAQAPAKPGSMFSMGNPDLGDAKSALPGARVEALAVADLFPSAVALVEGMATETAFRRNAAAFRYLHLASHGEFFPDAPLESRLRLGRDARNDGNLTVGELYSLRLDVDMATLSACETGLGELANGDEYVGLTRGFLYAGARTVVASMWKVDDASTVELMKSFYGGLASMDRREALRQAQVTQLAKQPHPYYWAAFQLTGSAR